MQYAEGAQRPEKMGRWLVVVILVLSIILPIALQSVKIALLVPVLFFIVMGSIAGRLRMSFGLYQISFAYAVIGVAGSVYGAISGNPGAFRVLTVMVFYPLLLPFVASLYRSGDEKSIYKVLLVCAWLLVVLDLIYLGGSILYPGNALLNIFDALYGDWAVIDNSDEYFKFTLPNVTSIIFILPFFISATMFPVFRAKRVLLLSLVLLLFLVGLLSGRRSLLLTMFLGPLVAYLLTMKKGAQHRGSRRGLTVFWLLFGAVVLAFFAQWVISVIGVDYYLDQLGSIFDFSENESNIERVQQYYALTKGIADSPLFGNGAGAVADYIRSDEQPWSYELFYLAIIFQYGFVGFFLYAAGILFIVWKLIMRVKERGRASLEFYLLAGFIAFMIASATNPYIGKFDSMWVLFLPYAVINASYFSASKTALRG